MEAAPSPPAQRLAHFGNGVELFAITLVNLLLKVVTLGIYHFWGKTRVRKYVWSHTRFAGEQFEYVGRGGELLRGYIIAMVIFLPALSGWQFLIEFYSDRLLIVIPVSLAGYGGFLFFSGLAVFSSRRYMLSRTRWRGVRFGLSGSAVAHGRKMLIYSVVLVLTGGIYFPFMRSNLYAHLAGNSWVGDRRFSYGGRGRELLVLFLRPALAALFVAGILGAFFMNLAEVMSWIQPAGALLPLLMLLAALAVYGALGTIWFWYRAREFRYFAGHTTLGEAGVNAVEVRTDFTAWEFMWLWSSNSAVLLLTLGLAYAWVVVRSARFFAAHLQLAGELDLEAIQQTAQLVPSSGEGLAEALDLGGI